MVSSASSSRVVRAVLVFAAQARACDVVFDTAYRDDNTMPYGPQPSVLKVLEMALRDAHPRAEARRAGTPRAYNATAHRRRVAAARAYEARVWRAIAPMSPRRRRPPVSDERSPRRPPARPGTTASTRTTWSARCGGCGTSRARTAG